MPEMIWNLVLIWLSGGIVVFLLVLLAIGVFREP